MRDISKTAWCFWVDDFPFNPIFIRVKRPRIGEIIKHRGTAYEVWYMEEGPHAQNARLERKPPQPPSSPAI